MDASRREMDIPFTAKEQRFVLAEMIKTSSVDIYQLENFVKAHGIVPDWMSMQLPLGRTMNDCMVATRHLSLSHDTHHARNPSASSSHGDYPSIFQTMSSPPTLQPSIPPPSYPPSYQRPSSALPRLTPNGLMPAPPTTTAATATVVSMPAGFTQNSPLSHEVAVAADSARPAPKKRGRPSRAERAKKELRPLLPQHLMPRPPAEHLPPQPQPPQYQPMQRQPQAIQSSPLPLPSLQSAMYPESHLEAHPATPSLESTRAIKKRRREMSPMPGRLPSLGDIMKTPSRR